MPGRANIDIPLVLTAREHADLLQLAATTAGGSIARTIQKGLEAFQLFEPDDLEDRETHISPSGEGEMVHITVSLDAATLFAIIGQMHETGYSMGMVIGLALETLRLISENLAEDGDENPFAIDVYQIASGKEPGSPHHPS